MLYIHFLNLKAVCELLGLQHSSISVLPLLILRKYSIKVRKHLNMLSLYLGIGLLQNFIFLLKNKQLFKLYSNSALSVQSSLIFKKWEECYISFNKSEKQRFVDLTFVILFFRH